MNITNIYENMSQQNKKIITSAEIPPILNTDVTVYANILNKKSYLNENADTQPHNTSQISNIEQPTTNISQTATKSATNSINQLLQKIQTKYNTSTEVEKALIIKILSSLS